MSSLLSSMGDLLIPHPVWALLPALLFGIGARIFRSTLLLWIALAWSLYCVYEYLMRIRVLCSGECNIRIDLLAIYPALFLLSAVGACYLCFRAVARKGGPKPADR